MSAVKSNISPEKCEAAANTKEITFTLLLSEAAHHICSQKLCETSRIISVAEPHFLNSCRLSDCNFCKKGMEYKYFPKDFQTFSEEPFCRTLS